MEKLRRFADANEPVHRNHDGHAVSWRFEEYDHASRWIGAPFGAWPKGTRGFLPGFSCADAGRTISRVSGRRWGDARKRKSRPRAPDWLRIRLESAGWREFLLACYRVCRPAEGSGFERDHQRDADADNESARKPRIRQRER